MVEEKIATPLVDEVLFGNLVHGGNVIADYAKGAVAFTFGNKNNYLASAAFDRQESLCYD